MKELLLKINEGRNQINKLSIECVKEVREEYDKISKKLISECNDKKEPINEQINIASDEYCKRIVGIINEKSSFLFDKAIVERNYKLSEFSGSLSEMVVIKDDCEISYTYTDIKDIKGTMHGEYIIGAIETILKDGIKVSLDSDLEEDKDYAKVGYFSYDGHEYTKITGCLNCIVDDYEYELELKIGLTDDGILVEYEASYEDEDCGEEESGEITAEMYFKF